MKRCAVYRLGLTQYEAALEFQHRLLEARKAGNIPDTLLLLQHPPVITIGRNGKSQNILASQEVLEQEKLPVVRTGRGGDVTCHAPGQLVGYPILNLRENGLGVSRFVWKLEEATISALLDFGIRAGRSTAGRGVFVNGEKICSLGLKIHGGISMHGFALNVNTDLRYFSYIIPCGLSGVKVTSLARLLGHDVEMAGVEDSVLRHFSEELGLVIEDGKGDLWLLPSRNG